jgi:drug/metabolite transporter (DMT)-like permease
MTPALGFALVIAAAVLFGTLGPLSRFAYDAGMPPTAFVTWRALIGVAGVGAFVAWRVRRGELALVPPGSLSVRVRLFLLVAALMAIAVNLSMFIAFDRITIALALLGFYTYPAMVALANVLLGRERLDAPRGVALALALAGVIAVIGSQLDSAAGIRLDVIGLGLALGAAVSQTVYVLISRDGYRAVPTEQVTVVVLLGTTIGAAIVTVVGGGGSALIEPVLRPGLLPLLLFAGIFTAAIPSMGFLAGIRTIGGTRAGILMLVEPVVGVGLAAWLLGESLVPIQLVGAAAILGAAIILQRTGAQEAAMERGSAPLVVPGGP